MTEERVEAQEGPTREVIINAAVPPELAALAESATAALKAHTAEGKAVVLMELRKRYDDAIAELRGKGYDCAIPDEKIMTAMGKGFGKELAEAVVAEWKKAVGDDKLDGLPEGIASAGSETAVVNMAQVVGRDAALTVFTEMFNKAFWEGFALACAIFAKFKDDILIANES